MSVMAIGAWKTNAALIADVAELGYLDGTVLDATFGLGRFWTEYQPPRLVACDLNPTKGMVVADFTWLPFASASFDSVVFDPPYRLNGTPDQAYDEGYGIEVATRWQERMGLIARGTLECARVSRKYLLVKCQDQVCSGQVRWQTDLVADTLRTRGGWRKKDRFELVTPQRPQPNGRSQVHARRNHSTLLVFVKN